MAVQLQDQQAHLSESQRIRRFFKQRLFFFFVILAIIIFIVWIASTLQFFPMIWATIISATCTLLGILLAIYTLLFPSETPHHLIIPTDKFVILPDINSSVIYQNIGVVKTIYETLIQENTSAVVLTGRPGVGKSTVAALVYHYAEQQRLKGDSTFKAAALWFGVDANLTISEMSSRMMGGLDKYILNFGKLPPQNQALALVHALDTTDEPRLIIIDQFENLLNWGRVHGNLPGVKEFLDALNSQIFEKAKSRVVLTSSSMIWGIDGQMPIHMQEYALDGLTTAESLELLKKQGVKTKAMGVETQAKQTESEIEEGEAADKPTAIDSEKMETGARETEDETKEAEEEAIRADVLMALTVFHGHALSLALAASILVRNKWSLVDLVNDPRLALFKTGNVTEHLLDYIYEEQLGEGERKLLLAFSVYRESVPFEAAEAVVKELYSSVQIANGMISALVEQHLLVPMRDKFYQLHPLVSAFAQKRFNTRSQTANRQALQAAHAAAAHYYLHLGESGSSQSGPRWGVSTLHLFVEATWQYCQAGQWQEAYDLMEREDIFANLARWGHNVILLELYLLLLPLDKWHPKRLQEAWIYNNLGEVYSALEKYEEALKHYKLALPLFMEEHDLLGEARALNNLGIVYSVMGQEKQLWVNLEQTWDSLAQPKLVHDTPDHTKKARKYRTELIDAQSYLKQALEYLDQALLLRKEEGDRVGLGGTLYNLGQVFSALGEKEQALRYYEEALGMFREMGDRIEEGIVLYNLGWVFNISGRKVKALEYLEQALRIQKEVGDRRGEGATFDRLGRVYDDRGELHNAWNCYQQALRIEREVGDRKGEARTLHNIGVLYYEQDPNKDSSQYREMLAFFSLAEAIFKEIHGTDRERVQRQIDALREKMGEEKYAGMFNEARFPGASKIVERALEEGLPEKEGVQMPASLSYSPPSLRKPPAAEVEHKPKVDGNGHE